MDQRTSMPAGQGPESAPVPDGYEAQSLTQHPEQALPTPEIAPQTNESQPVQQPTPEKLPGGAEAGHQNQGQPLVLPQVAQIDNTQGTAAQDPAQASAPQSVPDDDSLAADDVDVIEKEWINRAKRIISATKEDPYRQEQEINKLQQLYLQKRYGKTLKSPDAA